MKSFLKRSNPFFIFLTVAFIIHLFLPLKWGDDEVFSAEAALPHQSRADRPLVNAAFEKDTCPESALLQHDAQKQMFRSHIAVPQLSSGKSGSVDGQLCTLGKLFVAFHFRSSLWAFHGYIITPEPPPNGANYAGASELFPYFS